MQEIVSEQVSKEVFAKAKEMLASGAVNRVMGWERGLFDYDITPRVFSSVEELEKNFVFDRYCEATVSKYLIKESRKEGKILAFLKPNDTYSFQQLVKEHRIIRENVYVIGVPFYSEQNEGKRHVIYDELLGVNDGDETVEKNTKRFDKVSELEAMTPDQRFAFWQNELSRCIRCNACRNVCPACSCELCVFDNPNSGISQKAAADSFEEKMFHIIRAFHVAGRCTDCGECSRVCPQNIPLHLLNRKYIKDINEIYGDYQAGEDLETRAPLNTFKTDDVEPSVVYSREKGEGGEN